MANIQNVNMSVNVQPDMNPTRKAYLVLSQNENGRELRIKIAGADIPAGSTATLAGTKPDGTVYSTTGTVDGNVVVVQEDIQMTAVAGTWYAKITVVNGSHNVCTAKIIITVDADPVPGDAIPSDSQLDGIVAECRAYAEQARTEAYGSPLTATTASAMTDKTRVYVYTGTESGYTAGNWYYWNGSAWTSGGVYNSVAVQTDTSLTQSGKAADSKAAGDAIDALKEDLALSLESSQSVALPIGVKYESGSISIDGNEVTLNTRIRSKAIPITAGDYVETDGTYACLVRIYNGFTPTLISYYGVTGGFQTDTIDLTKYAGKYARIVSRKVGHESEDISADVATIAEHIAYKKTSQIKEVYRIIKPLTKDDFIYASISTAGAINWLNFSNGFGNAITKDLLTQSMIVKPVSDDVMFRIVYYDITGSWVSNGSWYSKNGTSASTATKGIAVGNAPYRIMIASTTQNQNKSVAELFGGFEFDVPSFETPLIPFGGYKINPKLEKVGSTYVSHINPYDYFINAVNGVTVFMAPDGVDSNDGLTVITPKKTFASALSVANVNTIILAEGTYQAGTHFNAGLEVTQALNLIGVGNVIIDNGTGYPINFYRSLFCENIHFKGGDNAIMVKLGTHDRIATFYHCKFSESSANNGLAVQGGICYVIECEAYNNAFDGFNYHAYNSIVNHAIEVKCKSYGNGHVNLASSDGQSSNATTSHDGSYIVRINGEYECCHGGIVADKQCYSANYGCSAGVSTVTDQAYPDRMSNYWCRGGLMWLYDCASFGSKYDTAIVEGGIINSNKIYASNYS